MSTAYLRYTRYSGLRFLESVDDANALVLLNPASGKRKALKIFETIVKPIFEIGGTPYTLKITESPNFAADFVENEDLSPYSSIVSISGDGLLHEILNGFLRRLDWPKYQTLPLAVIPAGSGNGLAKSLDYIWPEQAAISVVKADVRPLDIMSATLASGRTEYCFLSMTWGLTADIDIESERMRWAGSARFDLYGTLRLMNLRYYGGRLHYLPALEADGTGSAQDGSRRNGSGLSTGNSSMVNILLERTNHGIDDAWGLPPPSFSSPLIRNSPKPQPSQLAPSIQPAVTLRPTLTAGIQLPIEDGSLPPRWKTIEGPFVQVVATNVPWLSSTFLACQRARISDGMIDLVYSGPVSKWQVIPYMSSSTKDDYMNKDGIEHVKVRAFILEPTGLRTTNKSPRSHQMIQSPKAIPLSHTKSYPSTNKSKLAPGFGSVRSAITSTSNGSKTKTMLTPQPPVPARVRSQNYAAYHQHTAGRNSSLLLQGLSGQQSREIDDGDSEEHSAGGSSTEKAVAAGSEGPVRIPEQAIFSVRSETALAQLTQEDKSTKETQSPASNTLTPQGAIAQGEAEVQLVETREKPVLEANIGTVTEKLESSVGAEQEAAQSAAGCRLVGSHGIVDLDGEETELGPVKIECLANLIRIICPPWLNESFSNRVSTMPTVKVPELIQGSLSREGSVLSFTNLK
ncbi:hypothetical protein GQ54DRAFT_58726 [Martensiomyces pterosporus]|nr:hypothetical protein GQ54DRAFT_58726 [Martensiomyces pterosporus]